MNNDDLWRFLDEGISASVHAELNLGYSSLWTYFSYLGTATEYSAKHMQILNENNIYHGMARSAKSFYNCIRVI